MAALKQISKENSKNITKIIERHPMQPTIPQSPVLETSKRAKTHRCSMRHPIELNLNAENLGPRSASLSKLNNQFNNASKNEGAKCSGFEKKRISSRQQQSCHNQSAIDVLNFVNDKKNNNLNKTFICTLQSSSSSSPSRKSKGTVPQAFKLSKPRCKMETKTSEDVDLEESQKHVFKARKLNKKLFEAHGIIGIPKVNTKPPTVPINFSLHTEKKRAKLHKIQVNNNDENIPKNNVVVKESNKNDVVKEINKNEDKENIVGINNNDNSNNNDNNNDKQ